MGELKERFVQLKKETTAKEERIEAEKVRVAAEKERVRKEKAKEKEEERKEIEEKLETCKKTLKDYASKTNTLLCDPIEKTENQIFDTLEMLKRRTAHLNKQHVFRTTLSELVQEFKKIWEKTTDWSLGQFKDERLFTGCCFFEWEYYTN